MFKEQSELKQYDNEVNNEENFFTPVLRPKKSRKEILESPINLLKPGEGENIFYNSDEESGPHLSKMKVYDQMDLTNVVRSTKRVKTIKLIKQTNEDQPNSLGYDGLTQSKDGDDSPFRFKYTADNSNCEEEKSVPILGFMSSKGDFKFLADSESQDN